MDDKSSKSVVSHAPYFIQVLVCPKFLECEIGFYETNCSTKCPNGTFGKDCQQICNCSPCHHANGCGNFKTTIFYMFYNVNSIFIKKPIILKYINRFDKNIKKHCVMPFTLAAVTLFFIISDII